MADANCFPYRYCSPRTNLPFNEQLAGQHIAGGGMMRAASATP